MKLASITAGLLAVGVLLGASSLAGAEEITLKNGQKIVGTIVGYEKDMFRIETDYGIALVRKDNVASIQVNKPDTAVPSPQEPAQPPRTRHHQEEYRSEPPPRYGATGNYSGFAAADLDGAEAAAARAATVY